MEKTIKVNIGLEEYEDFQLFFMKTDKHMKKVIKKNLILIPAIFLLFFAFFTFYINEAIWKGLILWAIFCVPFLTLYSIRVEYGIRRSSRKRFEDPANAFMFGERKMTFTEAGIEIETPQENSEILWPGIIDYKETEINLFLYASTMHVLIVPKKQLSQEDLNDILNLVSLKVNKKED